MNTINIKEQKTLEAVFILTSLEMSDTAKMEWLEKKGWNLNQMIDLCFLADDYAEHVKSWRAV